MSESSGLDERHSEPPTVGRNPSHGGPSRPVLVGAESSRVPVDAVSRSHDRKRVRPSLPRVHERERFQRRPEPSFDRQTTNFSRSRPEARRGGVRSE
jgi:hypothetical protein